MTRSNKEDGAVLLTTLLVMGLMAALAVALIEDVRFAVKRTGHVQAYAQADWYAQGAEAFAQTYLSNQIKNLDGSQLNTIILNADPIIFPYEGGAMSLSLQDGSGCFDLRQLSTEPGRKVFRQLLTVLGWNPATAARLTSIAIDWQDVDSQVLPDGAEDYTYLGRQPAYRTPNREFASITELRALETMTEAKYQTLRPFVCARGASGNSTSAGGININTLTPRGMPLLAAVLGGVDGMQVAQQLVTQRPAGGYVDEAQFLAAPALEGFTIKPEMAVVTYVPDYIRIEADIVYLQARRRAAYEFSIEGSAAVRIYRGFGDEAMRPRLDTPPT